LDNIAELWIAPDPSWRGDSEPPPRDIYINDLFISEVDSLNIIAWVNGYQIYVKDNDFHTLESLKRITFDNYQGGRLSASWKRLSNGYYEVFPTDETWTPPPAPESATCGAIFGAVGLGLVGYRQRLRRRRCASE